MTRLLDDPSLALPQLPRGGGSDRPRGPDLLTLRDPTLGRASPVEQPLVLDGERGWARCGRRGVERLVLDGTVVADALGWTGGVPVNQVVSPGLLRRESVDQATPVEEMTLLLRRLPLLALQRTAPSEVELVLLPEADQVALRRQGGLVVAEARPLGSPREREAAGGDRIQVVALLHDGGGWGSGDWEVEEAPGGGVHLRGRFPAPASETASPVGLVLAAAPAEGMSATLGAADHLPGHLLGAAQPPRDGLRVVSGVRALDDGVDWARTRLATAARRVDQRSSWDRFWTRAGALAGGVDPGPVGATSGSAFHPREVWLAAERTLTTGDPRAALRRARALGPGTLPERDAALAAPALTHLADALRHGAPGDTVTALRRRAEELTASGGERSGGGPVRLPMLGQYDADPPGPAATDAGARPGRDADGDPVNDPGGRVLAHLLSGGTPAEPTPGWSTAHPLLASWVHLRTGRVDQGWRGWREVLAAGMEGRIQGPGVWDLPGKVSGAPVTGRLLAVLVWGILGWRPDAPVGRATLAPRLPAHLTRFRVEGLRVGDLHATFDYEREGPLHRFRVEPTEGRAPVSLVFEPWIAGGGEVASVHVDGRDAELDARREGDAVVLPLQVALDGPRTLEVRLEAS